MNNLKLFAVFPLLSMQLAAATAATLDIDGKYGNPAGCKFAATNNAESDDLLLLTPTEVETYVTFCSFVQVLPAGATTRVVTTICGHEGEEMQTIELMRIEKDGNGADAYTIFSSSGDS